MDRRADRRCGADGRYVAWTALGARLRRPRTGIRARAGNDQEVDADRVDERSKPEQPVGVKQGCDASRQGRAREHDAPGRLLVGEAVKKQQNEDPVAERADEYEGRERGPQGAVDQDEEDDRGKAG